MGVKHLSSVLAAALFAAVLLSLAIAAEPATRHADVHSAQSAALQILLSLDSADVSAASPGTWVPVYLQNTTQSVGGFEVSLLLDRPDLFRFPADSTIETTIVCIDQIDCNPADTTIDTVAVSPVDTVGMEIQGWEFVQARALSPINLKLAALANEPSPPTTPPLPPTPTGEGPWLLCKVYLEKVAPQSVLDTLEDRKTRIFIDHNSTSFSTPNGTTIGRLSQTVCLNPPSCTQLDTVFYTDTSAFFYLDGVRQFGPGCTRGDLNANGTINSADIIYLVNFVFKGGQPPQCSPTTGDTNCNNVINSADIIYLVNYVFKGGAPPPC